MSNIDTTINKINKKFGENTIGKLSEMPSIKTTRVSSGSPYLDWCVGGGWPVGRIIELFGNYSSGKSLVALRTISEFQKQNLNCVYIDAENAFDPDFAKKVGIDTKKLIITQAYKGEDVFDMIDEFIDTEEVSLIVVDSVASVVPQYEINELMEKQTIGLHARMMSKALRKITAKASKTGTTIIFINQIRQTPTSYGNPNITTGGKALGFYASLRVEVSVGDKILEDKKPIGQQVKFKVNKSKVCPPFRDGYFVFYYFDVQNPVANLFDDADELVSMMLIAGKIKRRGKFYDVAGQTFQGREELEDEIRNNDKFKKELITLNQKEDKKTVKTTND